MCTQCISRDISVTVSVQAVYITYFCVYRKCSDSVYHMVFLEVQEVFRQ